MEGEFRICNMKKSKKSNKPKTNKPSASAVARLGIPVYQWWSDSLHGVATSPLRRRHPRRPGIGRELIEDEVFWTSNFSERITSDGAKSSSVAVAGALDLSVVEDDSGDSDSSGGESGAIRPQRALLVRAVREALALAPVLGAGKRPGARKPEEVRCRDRQRRRRRRRGSRCPKTGFFY